MEDVDRNGQVPSPPPQDLGGPLGFIGETKGARLPHSPMAGSNFQLQHHGHPQGPRGPPAQEAIIRRFMRFEMLSRDEIKNWDTYETVTPEAVAAIFK